MGDPKAVASCTVHEAVYVWLLDYRYCRAAAAAALELEQSHSNAACCV